MAIIDKPTDYFNTVLYTGNGGTNAITGVGFQPDWIWFKNRTSPQSHAIVDSVRGREGLQSNATDEEYTFNSGEDFGTFDSDGFTVLVPQQLNSFNYNTGSIVSWNWKAGGTASSNTDGSITSSVSANTTNGFSIVSYTGTGANATVGHGLGVAPSMVITKRRSGADDWIVWHKDLTNPASYLYLNGTNIEMGSVAAYQNITPTSILLYPGTDSRTNNNGDTYISYVFAEKQGYSKFGSYTGNGNADGTFVYTGFKPAFVMVKNTNAVNHFAIYDNKRNGFNTENNYLRADGNYAEGSETWGDFDLFSNGFKPRATDAMVNSSGNTFIYMAFAAEPFTTSTGIPCTAR